MKWKCISDWLADRGGHLQCCYDTVICNFNTILKNEINIQYNFWYHKEHCHSRSTAVQFNTLYFFF